MNSSVAIEYSRYQSVTLRFEELFNVVSNEAFPYSQFDICVFFNLSFR